MDIVVMRRDSTLAQSISDLFQKKQKTEIKKKNKRLKATSSKDRMALMKRYIQWRKINIIMRERLFRRSRLKVLRREYACRNMVVHFNVSIGIFNRKRLPTRHRSKYNTHTHTISQKVKRQNKLNITRIPHCSALFYTTNKPGKWFIWQNICQQSTNANSFLFGISHLHRRTSILRHIQSIFAKSESKSTCIGLTVNCSFSLTSRSHIVLNK